VDSPTFSALVSAGGDVEDLRDHVGGALVLAALLCLGLPLTAQQIVSLSADPGARN
jgi:hypothetical protein